MADIYEALATEARRKLLDVLCQRDGQSQFEIRVRLLTEHGITLTRQAVSQHLDVLEEVGLVSTSKQGRCKLHFVDLTPLEEIGRRWQSPKQKGDNQT